MTEQPMAPVEVPPVDLGNPLLSIVPAQMHVSEHSTPAGRRAAVTIRTPCSTQTVFLTREELSGWAQVMQQAAAQMGGLVLASGGVIPDLSMLTEAAR